MEATLNSPSVTGDPGGTQTSFTVPFNHSGSYAFHCQYHASAGMVGTLIVS
jgi:plastocyanin